MWRSRAIGILMLGLPTAAHAEGEAAGSASSELIKITPSLLWIFISIAVLFWLRKPVFHIVESIQKRVAQGGALEIWQLKLPALPTPTPGSPERRVGNITATIDKSREGQRQKVYSSTKNIMPAFDAVPSKTSGQISDVVLFVVGHNTNLDIVSKVEYYLGKYWNHGVFTSSDPLTNFGVKISAYGSALVLVKIHFKDGASADTSIYARIDAVK